MCDAASCNLSPGYALSSDGTCQCKLIFLIADAVLYYAVSEIVRLASQFASQHLLGFYSKLNLGSKFHAEVATHPSLT